MQAHQNSPNFRDVGEFINFISGQPLLPENRLFRSGKLDAVLNCEEIGSPQTIINLRQGPELQAFGAQVIHLAAANDIENYNTEQATVRRWLSEVIRVFERPGLAYPVLIHCTSGKDRTGVVIAALLSILDIPRSAIITEYLLSEGRVEEFWITQALDGIEPLADYFKSIDLNAVKNNFMQRE